MNDKFVKRLTEYLDSECSDYGMKYSWEWDDDCEVKITLDHDPDRLACINFRYNEDDDDLSIELIEDSFYRTREFDETVKYFWMKVSPSLFPDN